MKTLLTKIYKKNENYLAKIVLSRLKNKSTIRNVWKSLVIYEKLVNMKNYQPDQSIRFYIEDECKKRLDSEKEQLHEKDYKRYKDIFNKYKHKFKY